MVIDMAVRNDSLDMYFICIDFSRLDKIREKVLKAAEENKMLCIGTAGNLADNFASLDKDFRIKILELAEKNFKL
jgi:dihydrodipicolinate reductase